MKLGAKRSEEDSLAFGGQAVIEGVMIRSKKHMVICVRQPNNEILTKTEEIKSLSKRYKVLRLPLLRGIVALFETLYLGFKGIYFSANASLEKGEEIQPKEIAIAVIVALALAVFLFAITPFFLTLFLTKFLKFEGIVFNVAEGVVRLAILLLYLASVSSIGDLRRIFQYHGAEHTAINAYEARVELDVENAKRYSRFHPRCGTSFLLIVALISILLFSIMPDLGFAARLAYRILLIPVIGSISYEILKLSNRYRNSKIMKILVAPGLGLQHLTTQKPDEDMIAVALKAVKKVSMLAQESQY